MTDKDLYRLGIIQRVHDHTLLQREAARLLELTVRQVQRVLRCYREHGAASVVSARRGRPGNNRIPEDLRSAALQLIRQHYADFGPTLACEKLAELHGVVLSKETVRKLMILSGHRIPCRLRAPKIQQPRCLGELIQIDGCDHRWFEERGPACTLLVYVDDATSRLMQLHFVKSESTFTYFEATRGHGKPLAFYSDKHAVFHVSRAETRRTGMTQFGRALHDLNIELICANSSQAKSCDFSRIFQLS